MPVALQHNETGAPDRPRTRSVEVSYDGGRTWRKADLLWNLAVLLRHPADVGVRVAVAAPAAAAAVSLRATAGDRAGNEVRQIVIRAYKLRK